MLLTKNSRRFSFAGIAGVLFLHSMMALPASDGRRTPAPVSNDNRIVKDRLHSLNNRNHADYSFLNAVGAVWSSDIGRSAAGYSASTGFLIDRCHALTNLHALYRDDIVIKPPLGKSVTFAVGQTDGDGNRGALQGMKFLLSGTVVAYGDTIVLDHLVHNPENDWALIRLSENVDRSIAPLTIATVDMSLLPKNRQLSMAGFPADHRLRRGDQFHFKDLWGSDGRVTGVVWAGTEGALIESTIQATRGDSGGPLYGDFSGHRHLVIGMLQGIRGNGIDVSEDAPNVHILFTPGTLAAIGSAQGSTPCG